MESLKDLHKYFAYKTRAEELAVIIVTAPPDFNHNEEPWLDALERNIKQSAVTLVAFADQLKDNIFSRTFDLRNEGHRIIVLFFKDALDDVVDSLRADGFNVSELAVYDGKVPLGLYATEGENYAYLAGVSEDDTVYWIDLTNLM